MSAPSALAEWARHFVTYVAGPAESEEGIVPEREEALAKEPEVITATLTIQKKLGLQGKGMKPFREALDAALDEADASPAVRAAAGKLLQKIGIQAILSGGGGGKESKPRR
ncbi:MAG: hypothetical protein PW734_04970 [Verrucomicrobium sp.]|nr:hypothetical protein [Verrucomicrobium sp.]